MDIPGTLQNLPPECARLFLEVERFVREELGLEPEGSSLLVALSGGADSTALLLFSRVMSGRWGTSVHAAHLDHMLRPESGTEAAHVARLCTDAGIGLTMERIDVRTRCRNSCGIEETARRVRYDFLERTRQKIGADMLLTGHHADDLSEDILMRLIRGAGWPGLAGMKGWDPERRLLRPFLLTAKNELTALLQRLGIVWIEDESNRELHLLRNRVRRSILPLLMEENPNIRQVMAQLWKLGRIDESFWDAALSWAPPAPSPDGEMLLPTGSLAQRHRAERLRVYKRCLDALGPGQALFESLLRLDEGFLQGRLGGVHQFPGSKIAKILPEGISFSASH
jgi:tRNA(Ile)-lysidine synthase